jgi:phage-related protein
VVASSPAELRTKVRDLAELLDADEPKPLIINDEPDKFINCIISDDSSLETIYRLGQTTIKMFAPDPFWYAVDDDIFNYTSTATQAFNRKGNADSYPTIEIKGTSAGGAFTLATDNNVLTFTGTLLTGETLVLDSELLTAYILKTDGSKVSAIPNLDSMDFPVLIKGANSIRVSVAGGAVLTSYKITCNSRWK